jgi:hypothetical protein
VKIIRNRLRVLEIVRIFCSPILWSVFRSPDSNPMIAPSAGSLHRFSQSQQQRNCLSLFSTLLCQTVVFPSFHAVWHRRMPSSQPLRKPTNRCYTRFPGPDGCLAHVGIVMCKGGAVSHLVIGPGSMMKAKASLSGESWRLETEGLMFGPIYPSSNQYPASVKPISR